MPRKSIAPWSERVNEGLIDQPIDSEILASQNLRPTVNTGLIDQTGTWKGNVSSDTNFIAFQTDSGVANAGEILTPSVNADNTWPLDMTGYKDLLIAIKPTNGGNYAISAVMGPATTPFANLSPVNAASLLKGNFPAKDDGSFSALVNDSTEPLTADVWNILTIFKVASNQKLLQFKIVNNTGGSSDIETAFMRVV